MKLLVGALLTSLGLTTVRCSCAAGHKYYLLDDWWELVVAVLYQKHFEGRGGEVRRAWRRMSAAGESGQLLCRSLGGR